MDELTPRPLNYSDGTPVVYSERQLIRLAQAAQGKGVSLASLSEDEIWHVLGDADADWQIPSPFDGAVSRVIDSSDPENPENWSHELPGAQQDGFEAQPVKEGLGAWALYI